MQGRLVIKNEKGEVLITKEQFGRADVKFKKGTKILLDYGNDLKAASTDALKKCASELGIASDIYGANEFKDIKAPQKPATPKATPQKTEVKANQLDQLKSKLYKLGAKTEIQALKLLEKKTGLAWKNFQGKTPKQVQIALANLLNSK